MSPWATMPVISFAWPSWNATSPTMFVKNWCARRGELRAQGSLVRVLHALRADDAARVRREGEVVADLERVCAPVLGNRRHRRCDLRPQARRLLLAPGGVGVVDELRARHVLELPGGGDVRECRIDLHTGARRADRKRARRGDSGRRGGRAGSDGDGSDGEQRDEEQRPSPAQMLLPEHFPPPVGAGDRDKRAPRCK